VKKTAGKTAKKPIQVVVDDDYLDALIPLLSKAKRSIDILSFSFAIGSARKPKFDTAPVTIAKKLKELKERRGKDFRIRLYIEGERETADRNRTTAEYLAAAGVEVVYGATHAKGFCIDERIVYFGSTNLTNQSITKNKEANLLIDDKKIAAEFMRYFEHLWSGGHHGEIELSEPMLADGAFLPAILEMIDTAKKTIDFSIYFFNQRDIERALIRAHERGVRIRGFVHQHASFALSYVWRNRSTVKRLRAAGIDQIHFSLPHTFSHSKYIVKDGKEFALGTGNWLDEDVEIHPQLYIRMSDVGVCKALLKHLKSQIDRHSTED
jgi:phosphatidylserine/phosphatidylglycerophosphate/cardiolipin synthase-like enzyme